MKPITGMRPDGSKPGDRCRKQKKTNKPTAMKEQNQNDWPMLILILTLVITAILINTRL